MAVTCSHGGEAHGSEGRMAVRKAICRQGLHARPAALFVKAVLDSGASVRLGREGGEPVDARSIVSVLALDIQAGEEVVLRGDDTGLLDRLVGLL
jgi:phosphocarrier protein HPr